MSLQRVSVREREGMSKRTPTERTRKMPPSQDVLRQIDGALFENCFRAAAQLLATRSLNYPYGPFLRRLTHRTLNKAYEIMGYIYFHTNNDEVALEVSSYFPTALQILVKKNKGSITTTDMVNMAFALYTGNLGFVES